MSGINVATKLLLAASPVTAIIGTRVWPVFPVSAAKMPYIVTHLIYEDDPTLLQGASKRPTSRISIECVTAGDVPQLFALAKAAIDALEDKVEVTIANCVATTRKEGTDETDSSDQTDAQGNPDSCRRIFDFYINWRAAP